MSDAQHDDARAVRAAAERLVASHADLPATDRGALERALPSVLGTLAGGAVLALLGGLTGALSLGLPTVIVALLVGGGAGAGLLDLARREVRREAERRAARQAADARRAEAGAELLRAVEDALAHVASLDAERARLHDEREQLHGERDRLHRKLDRLERSVAAKERKIARLQAFDAQRRTLEPPPPEPMAGQLTFDAVAS